MRTRQSQKHMCSQGFLLRNCKITTRCASNPANAIVNNKSKQIARVCLIWFRFKVPLAPLLLHPENREARQKVRGCLMVGRRFLRTRGFKIHALSSSAAQPKIVIIILWCWYSHIISGACHKLSLAEHVCFAYSSDSTPLCVYKFTHNNALKSTLSNLRLHLITLGTSFWKKHDTFLF